MQRNFLRGLLVCLIPCLLAAVFVVRPEKYKLGIDLAGGTILVYEINLERSYQRKVTQAQSEGKPPPSREDEGLDSAAMNELAAQIKRRIDPTDIKNVTVRPVGRTRFEIILPKSGAASGRENLSSEEIDEVKRLISQMGVLEFRILANGTDDLDGIVAARAALDNKSAEAQLTQAKSGLAPDGPDGEFTVNIGDSSARVRYVWVELGQDYRAELGLSNASEGQSGLWAEAARARAAGKTFLLGPGRNVVNDNAAAAMVMFSRDCKSIDQLQKEENDRARLKRENSTWSDAEIEKNLDRKKYEYFVLTRVSPEDSLRVGGDITLTAHAETDRSFNPAVGFTFNSAGAQQFGKITRRNKPTGSTHRQLAIMLDDRIVSSPNLQGEITSQGQITGRFEQGRRSTGANPPFGGTLAGTPREAGEREHHRPNARPRHHPQGDDGGRHGLPRRAGLHGLLLPVRRDGRLHRVLRQPAPDSRVHGRGQCRVHTPRPRRPRAHSGHGG